MTSFPYLYISTNDCQGSHGAGWHQSLPETEGLPPVPKLMAALSPEVFQTGKIGVLIEDDLLHPLRIEMEEKVSSRELPQFLLWKLKRFLPYPVDQAAMRYLPLREKGSYLTFSLPDSWVRELFEAFRKEKVHCGYMGGLFATLAENHPLLRDRLSICFYRDCYLVTELDAGGAYLDFRLRRLPYDQHGQLEVTTLVESDLAPLLRARETEKPVLLLNLSGVLDTFFERLVRALKTVEPELDAPLLRGATVARFLDFMAQKAVAP